MISSIVMHPPRLAKDLMKSSLSICHKIVQDSATQLHTMLTHPLLYYSDDFSKYGTIGHHIYLLKLNQICPLSCYIFNTSSKQYATTWNILYSGIPMIFAWECVPKTAPQPNNMSQDIFHFYHQIILKLPSQNLQTL
jgi:hypothetical protein